MTGLLLSILIGLGWAAPVPKTRMKPAPAYGILLLAHGGNENWNKDVLSFKENLKPPVPIEVAFGMADPDAIQAAVDRLELSGAAKIVAVPLFINSASEVLEQTRYVLGIAEKPSEVMRAAAAAMAGHGHQGHVMFSLKRVKIKKPLAMTPALDDHPLIAEVLVERAKKLSRGPAAETVILVGHGPVDDKANAVWMKTMRQLEQTVKEKGNFKAVLGATLRDDAPKAVRAQAVAALREMVQRAALNGKVLVVPYLIAQGGIEQKIVEGLKGLTYAWDAKTLCPHPNIARWISESAALGAKREDMRRFK